MMPAGRPAAQRPEIRLRQDAGHIERSEQCHLNELTRIGLEVQNLAHAQQLLARNQLRFIDQQHHRGALLKQRNHVLLKFLPLLGLAAPGRMANSSHSVTSILLVVVQWLGLVM